MSGKRSLAVTFYRGGATTYQLSNQFPIAKQKVIEHKYDELIQLIAQDRVARKSSRGTGSSSSYRVSRKIKHFGYRLFRLLCGERRNLELDRLIGDDKYLQLCLDENTRLLPWELAFDGEDFLCTRYEVARISAIKDPKFQSDSNIYHHGRALVIGCNYYSEDREDDLTSLEYCDREAEQVSGRLEKLGFSVALAVDENATKENVLAFLKEGVDVFHFTGHAGFNKTLAHDESGKLCLYDEDVTTRDLEKAFSRNGAPLLSFMNGCESGREKYIASAWEPHKGMASAFLDHGAGVFVGTFWPVDDRPSKQLSVKFYDKLAKGATIGEAMRATRLFCKLSRSQGFRETWPAYVVYGDPELTLTEY
jgi:CHAT domain-containing protein